MVLPLLESVLISDAATGLTIAGIEFQYHYAVPMPTVHIYLFGV